jgi:thioredoxin-like negative regulator of GroEL
MCSVTVRSRLRSSALALVSAATLLWTSACGGQYVSRGVELYADARYVDAAEVFEQTEARLGDASASERARFGLYRGATYLKLGDALHAAQWLGYSRSILNRDPGALDSDEHAMLEASLKALTKVPPSTPEPQIDSEVAAAPTPANTAPTQ